jgi:DNA (cytosine-5)-methyltransferase 1
MSRLRGIWSLFNYFALNLLQIEIFLKQHTYIDLFAGCGGLSLGLHFAGWRGIFAIEKNKDAFKTLKYNLVEKLNHFDWVDWLPIQEWEINEVIKLFRPQLQSLRGTVDMVVGGPPCQGFSSAGKRNESDIRNDLIKSYLEFVSIVMPKVIFFENVKGFTLKFEKNKTMGIAYSKYVLESLKQLGYDVEGQMVNFSEYGIPQKRIRFILVGVRKDITIKTKHYAKDFFELLQNNRMQFLTSKGFKTDKTTLEQAISDLLSTNGTINTPDRNRFKTGLYGKPKSPYQKAMRNGIKNNIPDSHSFANHTSEIEVRFAEILNAYDRNKNIGKQTLIDKFKTSKHSVIPLNGKDRAPTLTTLPDDFIHYFEPRILTVREYARIQSFPDWFEFKGKYTTGGKDRVKDVPRYTQIGNAIPPLFGEQSGLILKLLLQNE